MQQISAKKYKTIHDWVRKMISGEFCKKLNINHIDKQESVLENFEIQTDHLIPARRPDLVILNKKKKTCRIIDFAVPADLSENQKKQKQNKYLDLARELKTTHKGLVIGL